MEILGRLKTRMNLLEDGLDENILCDYKYFGPTIFQRKGGKEPICWSSERSLLETHLGLTWS